jgi:hypothetical protein
VITISGIGDHDPGLGDHDQRITHKGMKLTSVERIGRSQLIPSVGWTNASATDGRGWHTGSAAPVA